MMLHAVHLYLYTKCTCHCNSERIPMVDTEASVLVMLCTDIHFGLLQ